MKDLYIRFKTRKQLETAAKWQYPCIWMADSALADEVLAHAGKEQPFCLVLPDIARQSRAGYIREIIEKLPPQAGIVAKNLDELGMLKEAGYQGNLIGDSFLYAYNPQALRFYLDLFPQMKFLCSDELTDRELASFADPERFIYKIYGYQQLMVSAQCISRNYTGCREKRLCFRDEKGNPFFAVSDCANCCSLIYNGLPTSMLDKGPDLGYENLLLDFTMEDQREMQQILTRTEDMLRGDTKALENRKITRGHHYTGID